jgi:hypothetical protein
MIILGGIHVDVFAWFFNERSDSLLFSLCCFLLPERCFFRERERLYIDSFLTGGVVSWNFFW